MKGKPYAFRATKNYFVELPLQLTITIIITVKRNKKVVSPFLLDSRGNNYIARQWYSNDGRYKRNLNNYNLKRSDTGLVSLWSINAQKRNRFLEIISCWKKQKD